MTLEPKLFQTENEKRTDQIAKSVDKAARGNINHIPITQEYQLWFATQETHSSSQLVGVEKLIYEELIKFKQFEEIQPSENQKEHKTFLN